MSEFNKHVGKFIDKDKADKHIKKWKKEKGSIKTESSFIGSDILMDLLKRPNVVGLRIHYALDDENYMQPVFTAEIDPDSAESKLAVTGTQQTYANSTMSCPPNCP